MRVKDSAAAVIGAERKIAVLSEESAIKNQANHPDLTLEDCAILPLLGETPTLIAQDTANTFVIVRDGGKIYWGVVKAPQSGGEGNVCHVVQPHKWGLSPKCSAWVFFTPPL